MVRLDYTHQTHETISESGELETMDLERTQPVYDVSENDSLCPKLNVYAADLEWSSFVL